MKAYYINLDSAEDRRRSIESAFAKFAPSSWELIRVPAVDADAVRKGKVPGTIRDTEKACLLSHRRAIEASMSDEEPTLILEDDAIVGPRGFQALDTIGASHRVDTDLLFTCSLISNSDLLLKQYVIYVSAMKHGKMQYFDMRQMQFAGADGYILMKAGKEKVLRLLDSVAAFNNPYDLLLKEWIHADRLKAVVTFPFLTSLSAHSDQSLNSNSDPDWNGFRRLFCIDSKFFDDKEGERGILSQSALEMFTDEYLKFVKILLTKYHEY